MQFTIRNKNYILIEVPSDFIPQKYGALDARNNIIWGKNSKGTSTITIKDEEYLIEYGTKDLILGKLSKILQNEELCSEIVEQHNSFFWKVPRFYNYLKYPKANINELTKSIPYDNLFEFFKATDSFKSFLQSINVDMSKEYLLISKL